MAAHNFLSVPGCIRTRRRYNSRHRLTLCEGKNIRKQCLGEDMLSRPTKGSWSDQVVSVRAWRCQRPELVLKTPAGNSYRIGRIQIPETRHVAYDENVLLQDRVSLINVETPRWEESNLSESGRRVHVEQHRYTLRSFRLTRPAS